MGNTASAATAKDFEYVHEEPSSFLIDKEELRPHSKPGEVFCLNMQTNPRGSITYASDDRKFPIQIKGTGRLLLQDTETKEVLATVTNDAYNGVHLIYGFRPLFQGQERSQGEHFQHNQVYEWATVKPIKDKQSYAMYCTHNPKRSTVTKVLNKLPSLETPPTFVAQPTSSGNSIVIQKGIRKCAMISRGKGGDGSFGKPFWNIKIGPGIDPALMLAFVAIVDQIIAASN